MTAISFPLRGLGSQVTRKVRPIGEGWCRRPSVKGTLWGESEGLSQQ